MKEWLKYWYTEFKYTNYYTKVWLIVIAVALLSALRKLIN